MADQKKLKDRAFQDCRLLFRNFSGKRDRYNAEGDRNFNLVLDEETARDMLAEGWNVKTLSAKEEGDEPLHILKVKVNYKGRPPRVVLITSRGKTQLDESTVAMLDFADIIGVDLMLNPYGWEVNGRTGITAYLGSIYVTIREDELELKYADVPYSNQTPSIGTEETPF